MSQITLYQVDAFADKLFQGNPAAVCILDEWLPAETLQAIARENNLSETAFVVHVGDSYHIRWFTPKTEVDLCGHATLASAFVLFEYLHDSQPILSFQSKSGLLQVEKVIDGYQMNFPALPYQKKIITDDLCHAIGTVPDEVYHSTFDLLCVLKTSDAVEKAQVQLDQIAQLPYRGLILSAQSSNSSIYSRCFYPACDVPEDPVTGSAHCVLAPYWCHRLQLKKIDAIQGLDRRGSLSCSIQNDRVLLSGRCQFYMKGEIILPSGFITKLETIDNEASFGELN